MDLFALSLQQRHIWDRGHHDFTLPRRRWLVQIHGPVEEARLQWALQTLASRHDMLRVRLHQTRELRYPLIEISSGDAPLFSVKALPKQNLLAAPPDDWACHSAQPLTVTLWYTADNTVFLTLDISPFCADSASVLALVDGLETLYLEGSCEGTPLQYLQYTAWQASEGFTDLAPMAAAPAHRLCRTIDTPLTRETALLAWQRVCHDAVEMAVATSGRFSDEFEGAVGAFSYYAPLQLERAPSAQLWLPVTERVPQFSWVDCRRKRPWRVLGAGSNPIDAWPGSFALEVLVTERDVTLWLTADTRIASQTMVGFWLSRVEAALEGADFPCIGVEEKRRLVLEALGDPLNETLSGTVLERIERIARQWPDHIAVRYEGESISYRHLWQRSLELASRLREAGTREQSCVGVLLPKSAAQVVAILGILCAGGVYVALDPQAPPPRLRDQLQDCQATAIVSDGKGIGAQLGAEILIGVDAGTFQFRTEAPGEHELAYVLYTSGSTGKPKGVAITQRGLLFSTLARLQAYKRKPITMLWTPAAFFDSSVAGLFWTLITGGTLIIPNEAQSRSPLQLAQLVRDHAVTHWLSVPSLYDAVLEGSAQSLRSLQTVIVAGAACPSSLVQRHMSVLKDMPLFNEYGPTEMTVWCTVSQLEEHCSVSIGKAIPGARVNVSGPRGELMPYGIRGELWAGGPGVAQGYLRRARETAQRFVPDMLGPAGARAYRTGDWGWRDEHGALHFSGRMDDQIKLHGFRIELAEIEAAFASLEAVAEIAAVVRGEQLLVYVAARGGLRLDEDGLLEHARKQLPAYMVPAAIVIVEQLPRLPNGKVDRHSLPDPTMHAIGRAPEGATEIALARLWQELLGVEQAGAQRDFFAAGGHSLLAMRMIAGVQHLFGVALSFDDVLLKPTIAAIARRIDALRRSATSAVNSEELQVDLETEAILDSAFVPPARIAAAGPRSRAVLLTGATGFLGAYLLRELLIQTHAQVHCLVRASSVNAGRERLFAALKRFELGELLVSDRIHVLRGDIAEPALGLGNPALEDLARSVDTIYHSGAVVNFVQPYRALKPVNVLGTRQILHLACTHQLKAVHYVSTLSVFGNESPGESRGFSEEEFPSGNADLGTGYNQSKWVAEQLVRNAGRRGVPVTIYRPATIGGDAVTGAWNTDDFVCRLIKGCALLGAAPDREHQFVIVPVDQVSRTIVALSLQAGAAGQTYHLTNSNAVTTSMLLSGCESRGWRIERVPFSEWRHRARMHAGNVPGHALHPLLPLLDAVDDDRSRRPEMTPRRYDNQRTCSALRRIGMSFVAADATHVERYYGYFDRRGFLGE